MMKRLIITACCFALAACGCQRDKECIQKWEQERADWQKVENGEAVLSATAPDGTQLWSVRRNGRMVYFSSRGTSYIEGGGKTSHTVTVPSP